MGHGEVAPRAGAPLAPCRRRGPVPPAAGETRRVAAGSLSSPSRWPSPLWSRPRPRGAGSPPLSGSGRPHATPLSSSRRPPSPPPRRRGPALTAPADGETVTQPRAAPAPTRALGPARPPLAPQLPSGTAAPSPGQPDAQAQRRGAAREPVSRTRAPRGKPASRPLHRLVTFPRAWNLGVWGPCSFSSENPVRVPESRALETWTFP